MIDAFLNSWYPQTTEVAAAYLEQADRIADTVLLPPVVRKYVMNSMSQYITSKDGSNYDKLFAKLKSTLELYKDEKRRLDPRETAFVQRHAGINRL